VKALAHTERSAGQGRQRTKQRARGAAVYLLYGAAATVAAGAGSLLVDRTAAKQVVWVVTALGFSVAAGIVHALRHPRTTVRSETDDAPATAAPASPAGRPEGAASRYPAAPTRRVPSPR
jgi:hypothetical protein